MAKQFDGSAVPIRFPYQPLGTESDSEEIPEATEDELEEQALTNAREQVRQQRALDKATAEADSAADDEPNEVERTDIDDLFAPTANSPLDEMERTDIDDITDADGDIPELSLTPEDEFDIFGVTQSDIMGTPSKPRRKKLLRATGKRYTPPTGLQGMGY